MPTPRASETHVQPGDLLELVIRLRRWMADRDTDAFLIEGSFEHYGTEVEAAAVAARPLVQSAADAIFQLVLALERTPEYKRLPAKGRDGPDRT